MSVRLPSNADSVTGVALPCFQPVRVYTTAVIWAAAALACIAFAVLRLPGALLPVNRGESVGSKP